eukprot:scaffold91740_cov118-Phaeocystis_antarctica.AAC.2
MTCACACACTCIQLHRSHVYSFAVAHALSWRSLVAGLDTRNATALAPNLRAAKTLGLCP